MRVGLRGKEGRLELAEKALNRFVILFEGLTILGS